MTEVIDKVVHCKLKNNCIMESFYQALYMLLEDRKQLVALKTFVSGVA